MPNHVTNQVKLSGKEKDIKDILSSLKTEKSDFDFNKIYPIPEELRDTVSSSAEPTNHKVNQFKPTDFNIQVMKYPYTMETLEHTYDCEIKLNEHLTTLFKDLYPEVMI